MVTDGRAIAFDMRPGRRPSSTPWRAVVPRTAAFARPLWGSLDEKCVIKGNISSSASASTTCRGQRYYDKTQIDESRGERWFCTEQEAAGAVWRKAKVSAGRYLDDPPSRAAVERAANNYITCRVNSVVRWRSRPQHPKLNLALHGVKSFSDAWLVPGEGRVEK